MSTQPDLGAGLRALRLSRKYSINQVAKAARISPSFLSLVENGKSDITIGRLTRLVEFFGVSVTDLLPGRAGEDPDVVQPPERRLLHSPGEGIDLYLLARDTNRAMMPQLLVFEPGASLAEWGRHHGEEFVHVLQGRLELELEGADARVLTAGASAYYRSDRRHKFTNAGTGRLRIFCVVTPPNW
jgi:transcriptional regulator with XRE-family HTH domain